MDTIQAFAMGRASQGRPIRVFDWLTAAKIIRERQPTVASAGLSGDWEWTGGDIYRNGEPVPSDDTYTYLASTWATPELDLDGDVIDCWVWQADSGWDSDTYWPAEALAVLRGES
jgi:hypothetical protein